MNISAIFIRRPVMTVLLMLTFGFFGFIAYNALPVSNLPDYDTMTAVLSGITAKDKVVTQGQLNLYSGMKVEIKTPEENTE